ncbi:MAG: hypothetical protein QXL30_06235, partial [Sulfolobales archaeon]
EARVQSPQSPEGVEGINPRAQLRHALHPAHSRLSSAEVQQASKERRLHRELGNEGGRAKGLRS